MQVMRHQYVDMYQYWHKCASVFIYVCNYFHFSCQLSKRVLKFQQKEVVLFCLMESKEIQVHYNHTISGHICVSDYDVSCVIVTNYLV